MLFNFQKFLGKKSKKLMSNCRKISYSLSRLFFWVCLCEDKVFAWSLSSVKFLWIGFGENIWKRDVFSIYTNIRNITKSNRLKQRAYFQMKHIFKNNFLNQNPIIWNLTHVKEITPKKIKSNYFLLVSLIFNKGRNI